MKRWFGFLFLIISVSAQAQPVTNLQTVHRRGQTFLTWDNLARTGVTYRVYCSNAPIIRASDLTAQRRLGAVGDSTSYNRRLSSILGEPNFFRIDSLAPALSFQKGLFVHTTTAAGRYYYAVTTMINAREDTTLTIGVNTLATALVENLGRPSPIWQRSVRQNARIFEVYTHWASPVGHANYPAMSSAVSVPFNFGLQRKGAAALHPLLVRFHGGEGNFLRATGTSNAEEWILSPDDNLPNSTGISAWYGYHETYDIFTGAGVPTTGVVHDYTARRIVWMIDWARRALPIDTTRVYLMGGSMGGAGSVFISMIIPEKIAAIYTTVPKFDFSFISFV